MAKGRQKIDTDQAAFDFEARLEAYYEAREKVLEACHARKIGSSGSDPAEACIEIAAAVKRSIRRAGLSREQAVDRINDYFGTPDKVSYHMMNHYLSKPARYPLPAYLIFALSDITGSLEIVQTLVEPMGGRVIGRDEVRQMTLGRVDENDYGIAAVEAGHQGWKP